MATFQRNSAEFYQLSQPLAGSRRFEDTMSLERQSLHQLIEFCWMKIMERFKSSTQAFRAIATKGNGKLSKGDLLQGFERLRIRISSQNFEKVWAFLDKSKKGFLQYQDFCIMADFKTMEGRDPRESTSYEHKIQETLAKERAYERDRIAQILKTQLECDLKPITIADGKSASVSRRVNNIFSQTVKGDITQAGQTLRMGLTNHHTFGVASLPNESINLLMHHDFNRQFLNQKQEKHEIQFKQKKEQHCALMNRSHRSRYEAMQSKGGYVPATTRIALMDTSQERSRSPKRDAFMAKSKGNMRPSSLPPLNYGIVPPKTTTNAETRGTQSPFNLTMKKNNGMKTTKPQNRDYAF